MKIQFHIDLPKKNLQRLGLDAYDQGLTPYDRGYVQPNAVDPTQISGRSALGLSNRELHRFFPVILLLESLTKINQWQMRRMKFVPLYKSGVRYQAEEPGREDWLDTPTLYAQGFGDCEDIACTYAAEQRHLHNKPAVPCIKFKDFRTSSGQLLTLIHVMTLMPDGTIADPSAVLGMEGEYQ